MICFHNVDEPNGYLANWYESNFAENGQTFTSVEQYMMWNKAIRFHDQKAGRFDFGIQRSPRKSNGLDGKWKAMTTPFGNGRSDHCGVRRKRPGMGNWLVHARSQPFRHATLERGKTGLVLP